jgi:predicted ATP-grasp superfamily ATP-dependent carboligase
VEALGRGRDLWGNRPEVLRRVRDPFVLMPALQAAGFRTPLIHRTAPDRAGLDLLVKTLASGGGQGVRPWVHGRRLPAGTLLQERISGVPASVTFLALRGTVLPVGLSRQLVGDAAFGATGYRYCGSLVAWHGRADGALEFAPGTAARAHALAAAASAAFGLVGLNGLDFIATEDGPVPVEVNPRWCGSLEPMDRRLPSPLFAAHVTACQGTVPARLDPPAAAPVLGKAIVFARQSVNVGDTQPWLDDPDIRDVPHPGDWIQAGSPACTVFAEAESPEACYRALVGRARRVYGDMHGWREASAL